MGFSTFMQLCKNTSLNPQIPPFLCAINPCSEPWANTRFMWCPWHLPSGVVMLQLTCAAACAIPGFLSDSRTALSRVHILGGVFLFTTLCTSELFSVGIIISDAAIEKSLLVRVFLSLR